MVPIVSSPSGSTSSAGSSPSSSAGARALQPDADRVAVGGEQVGLHDQHRGWDRTPRRRRQLADEELPFELEIAGTGLGHTQTLAPSGRTSAGCLSRLTENFSRVERNRLSLDCVGQHDKHFYQAVKNLRKVRCRGLVQPDHEDPGGADLGPAGGHVREATREITSRPFVDGVADAERRYRRACCWRRSESSPRGSESRPSASSAGCPAFPVPALQPQLSPDGAHRDHHGAAPGHRDGRRVRLHRAPAGRSGQRRHADDGHAARRCRRIAGGAA